MLALLAIIEVACFAKGAASGTHFTISGCAVCVVACWTSSETAIRSAIEVVPNSAQITLGAVGRRD